MYWTLTYEKKSEIIDDEWLKFLDKQLSNINFNNKKFIENVKNKKIIIKI